MNRKSMMRQQAAYAAKLALWKSGAASKRVPEDVQEAREESAKATREKRASANVAGKLYDARNLRGATRRGWRAKDGAMAYEGQRTPRPRHWPEYAAK